MKILIKNKVLVLFLYKDKDNKVIIIKIIYILEKENYLKYLLIKIKILLKIKIY